MQKDLSQGKVFATMSLFALPMLLGNVLQQAYNVVDTWVVGRFVGAGALAGVGSSFTLMTFLTSILLGLCMGSGVVFSTCFGRQDEAALKSSVGNSFVLALAVTAALTAVPLLCVDAIVGWLNTPAEIFQLTRDYLYIVFSGFQRESCKSCIYLFHFNFFSIYLCTITLFIWHRSDEVSVLLHVYRAAKHLLAIQIPIGYRHNMFYFRRAGFVYPEILYLVISSAFFKLKLFSFFI